MSSFFYPQGARLGVKLAVHTSVYAYDLVTPEFACVWAYACARLCLLACAQHDVTRIEYQAQVLTIPYVCDSKMESQT